MLVECFKLGGICICTQNRLISHTQVEMKALEDLLSSKLPRLAAHMRALEADVGIIATEW